MVPGDVLILDSFPYLASGKLDRNALRDRYRRSLNQMSPVAESPSLHSTEVATIVSSTIGVDVNAHTLLRNTGLDSLSAIRVASQLSRAGFLRLDANAILGARSVTELAAMLSKTTPLVEQVGARHTGDAAVRQAWRDPVLSDHLPEIEDIFICTPMQSAMLLETARNPEANCNWIKFQLHTDACASDVQHALRELSRHHQLLRAGFVPIISQDTSHAVVVWKDILAEQVQAVNEMVHHFELKSDYSLLRPCRFQIQRKGLRWFLLLQIHHALYDQWSIDLLRRDLSALLQQQKLSGANQFSAVSEYYAAGEALTGFDDLVTFWRDELCDFRPTLLAAKHGDNTVSHLEFTPWREMSFDLQDVKTQMQQLDCSLPSLFQAAAACVLGCGLHQADVTLGAVFSGRHVAVNGIENVFGPCLTTLPVRVDLAGPQTLGDVVTLVQNVNRAVQRHAVIPLPHIKSLAGGLPGKPLFDVLCIWQETSLGVDDFAQLVTEVASFDKHAFTLVIEFEPRKSGIALQATYDQYILSNEHANKLLQQIEEVAQAILLRPTSRMESLASLLGPRWRDVLRSPGSGHRYHARISQVPQQSNGTSVVADENCEWSTLELHVCAALVETLNMLEHSVGRKTSFFSLGLHSLNAIAFSKALERRLHRTVAIGQILRKPTVLELSAALRESDVDNMAYDESALMSVFSPEWVARMTSELESNNLAVDYAWPCTPLQETMLASSERSADAYCNTVKFRVAGDGGKVQECWQKLQARHAILRTVFVATESSSYPFAQVILKQASLPWRSTFDRESENHRTPLNGVKDHEQPKVNQLAPWHIEIDESGCDAVLTLRMHHAIYDGIAMAVLLDEMENLYKGKSLLPAPPFEPVLSEMRLRDQTETIKFWSSRIQGYHPRPFPTAQLDSDAHEHTLRSVLDVGSSELHTFCKRFGVTPLSVLQAGWAKTLGVAQNIDDVCFGNVVSGRHLPLADIERLVAPCFNTIPLRVHLSKARTNDKLVRYFHRENLKSLPHCLMSLRRIQALSGSPNQHLFDSILLVQPDQHRLDETIWQQVSDEGTMDVPMVLEILPVDQSYIVAMHFLPVNVCAENAASLLSAFVSSVTACLRNEMGDAEDLGDVDRSYVTGRLFAHRTTMKKAISNGDDLKDTSDAHWTAEELIIRGVFARLSDVNVASIHPHTSLYQIGLDSLNAAQVASQSRRQGLDIDISDVMQYRTARAIAAKARRTEQSTPSTAVDLDAFDRKWRPTTLQDLGVSDGDVEAVWPCTSVQSGMLAHSLESTGSLYINTMTYEVLPGISKDRVRTAWKLTLRKHQVLRMGFHLTQDARHPFVMLIHAPVVAERMISRNEVEASWGDMETRVAAAITHDIHLPAWRLAINDHDGWMSMTLSIHHALYDTESLQLILIDFEAFLLSQPVDAGLDIGSVLAAALGAASDQPDGAETFWRESLGSTR